MRTPYPTMVRWMHFCRRQLFQVVMLFLGASVAWGPSNAKAQGVFEYTPYKVKIWLSISPTLSLTEKTQEEIQRLIAEYSEINFGPTWDVSVESTPEALFGSVLYRLDELTVEQLLARELVLIVGRSDQAKDAYAKIHPPPKPVVDPKAPKKPAKADKEVVADLEAKAASLQGIRTLETAIERMPSIAVQPIQFSGLQRDIRPYLDNKQWTELQTKLKRFDGSFEDLQKQLDSGETLAALVQKSDIDKFRKVSRQLPTRLPWQPEGLLRNNDKIFMVSVDRVEESLQIRVKELDSYVRRMSDIATTEVVYATDIPRAVSGLALSLFSPVVRIEETDFKTAVLRVKAGGLLTREEHPIRVSPGDVIVPVIRRDDANGNPTVLQPIPFTFVAITEKIDQSSRLFGAIFTASKGALASAKNRRTVRVGLKLNPRFPETMLKLGIQRLPGNVVPGTEVYLRTPGDDDLKMIGRTDWRGMLPLTNTEMPTIQYDPPGESKNTSIAKAREMSRDPVAPPKYRLIEVASDAAVKIAPLDLKSVVDDSSPGNKKAAPNPDAPAVKPADAPEKKEEPAPPAAPAPPPPAPKERGFIQINVPLYLYYIKNGSTLLARLPIVTGQKPIETADLPDDRRRLEAEAFFKGIQGEVLDLVIRRKILESRIRKSLRDKKLDLADRLLEELKKVKSGSTVQKQIDDVERYVTSKDRDPLGTIVLKKITSIKNVAFNLARDYLKDGVVGELESEVAKAK